MIKLNHINKTYISKKNVKTEALKDINLNLPEKGLIFIVGKTGCGKSTLLNILGKLDEPTSGEIVIGDTNLTTMTQNESCDYINHFVGFVFQNYNLLDELTVYENIALAQKLQGKNPNKEEIDNLLEKLSLTKQKYKLCDELSGGQRQRVAIARAIIKKPKMILADEPTGAIDSKTGKEILEILKEISKETLVIIVSHNIDFATSYADHIIKMADGKIIENSLNALNYNEKYILNRTRGNISFKECFKLGFFNLGHRIKRIITIILVLVTTFIGLGIVSTFIHFDQSKILLESMENENITYLTLAEKETSGTKKFITKDKIEKLQNKYPNKTFYPIYVRFEDFGDYTIIENVNQENYKNDINNEYYNESVLGEMEINEEIAKDLKINLLAGVFPSQDNEIVLTQYQYQIFEKYNAEKYEVNSYNDIIGKTIFFQGRNYQWITFKVVGIIDTKFNVEKYFERDENGELIHSYANFCYDIGSNIASFIFHNYGYLNNYIENPQNNIKLKYYGACISINAKKDKKLINHLYKYEDLKPDNLYSIKINEGKTILKKISEILFIGTISLIILSTLMLYIYVRNIIDDKRKQIGVLRSLGTTKIDILKIFLVETFSLSLIVSIIAIVGSLILTKMFNNYLIDNIGISLKLLSFNLTTVLTIIIISFGISFISTYIPINKINKLSPIDSLKIKKDY